jgi:hypothetical protein
MARPTGALRLWKYAQARAKRLEAELTAACGTYCAAPGGKGIFAEVAIRE